jgi:hypothetical protein
MSIDHQRIAALSKQIQSLAKEIALREQRLALAVSEFHRLTEPLIGRALGAAPHEVTSSAPLRRSHQAVATGTPKGELTSRILDFLASKSGQSFDSRTIAQAVSARRSRSVYMSLYRLGKKGHVKKTAHGYSVRAEERQPVAS